MKLHANDAVALVELWSGIRSYVPVKDQKQAAEQYIAILDDSGLADLSTSSVEMYGVCDVFDLALRTYCEENGLVEDTSEFEDWDE